MRKNIEPSSLARDDRFNRQNSEQRFADTRDGFEVGHVDPKADDVGERARRRMHGIFVGEIQALEGAGRTAFDFGTDEVPYELKLDMARQCWDEARHCEISVKLAEHMGGELGEYVETTTLFEAACHDDPVFRLAGVNRALEGLAIDVFSQMRDFGSEMNDPILEFCEDYMLADEVTHVKMGSKWLRAVTEDDPERRKAAIEFQRVVDGLFNFRGVRGEEADSPIRLARQFRKMAGFTDSEVDHIAETSLQERLALQEQPA
ncbi:MAG: uncharacterized ferritin-like protein (DUF455 family) [Acidimicrobiales bacterium]|jgi:uncharacterized ferritin-like protein (DUF455 family)